MSPTPGRRLLLLPVLLHNRPLCQAGTRSLIAFTTVISVSQCSSSPSLSEMPRLQGHGVLALTPVYTALVLPSVSAHRALGHLVGHCPYWLSGQSGKSTPWCRPCRLFGKRELTTYNTLSVLSGDVSTASQSSTGAQAARITAT